MNRSAQPLPSGSRNDRQRRSSVALARRVVAPRGRRALDAKEGDLRLEVVAHILAAMVVAELEAGGDLLGKGAEALTHRLSDRFQRLEAIAALGGMDASAFGGTVIDGDEHGGLALAGHDCRHVRAPHLVDPLGRDGTVMGLRATRPASTLMGQQLMLAQVRIPSKRSLAQTLR